MRRNLSSQTSLIIQFAQEIIYGTGPHVPLSVILFRFTYPVCNPGTLRFNEAAGQNFMKIDAVIEIELLDLLKDPVDSDGRGHDRPWYL